MDVRFPSYTAWDGTSFQVLTPDGTAFDAVSTQAALSAYVAAHPAPVAPPAAVKGTRYQFLLLFTAAERAAFMGQRAQANALQPGDYSDPTKANIVALAAFIYVLDTMGPADIIDMSDPDIIAALELLVQLAVITEARKTVILTGARP